jgi:hypothetical protein
VTKFLASAPLPAPLPLAIVTLEPYESSDTTCSSPPAPRLLSAPTSLTPPPILPGTRLGSPVVLLPPAEPIEETALESPCVGDHQQSESAQAVSHTQDVTFAPMFVAQAARRMIQLAQSKDIQEATRGELLKALDTILEGIVPKEHC